MGERIHKTVPIQVWVDVVAETAIAQTKVWVEIEGETLADAILKACAKAVPSPERGNKKGTTA